MAGRLAFRRARPYNYNKIRKKGKGGMRKLYDVNMQPIGYLQEGEAGTRRVLYDRNRRVLGYYYPASDKTYDRDMRPVGRGDLLAGLLASKDGR